jgi:hypothetical protein
MTCRPFNNRFRRASKLSPRLKITFTRPIPPLLFPPSSPFAVALVVSSATQESYLQDLALASSFPKENLLLFESPTNKDDAITAVHEHCDDLMHRFPSQRSQAL